MAHTRARKRTNTHTGTHTQTKNEHLNEYVVMSKSERKHNVILQTDGTEENKQRI